MMKSHPAGDWYFYKKVLSIKRKKWGKNVREINLYTKDGCLPCKKMRRELINRRVPYDEIILKGGEDVDGVDGFPTVVIYDNEKEIARFEGYSEKTVESITGLINEQW